jgi:hypothetical protein
MILIAFVFISIEKRNCFDLQATACMWWFVLFYLATSVYQRICHRELGSEYYTGKTINMLSGSFRKAFLEHAVGIIGRLMGQPEV